MKKKLFTIPAIIVALVLAAGYGLSQTQFFETNDIMFRGQDPQMRWVGTATARNQAGTVSGMFSHSQPTIVSTGTTVARTLLATECGAVVIDNATSSTQTYTLPAIGNTGCMFTFIAGHASGEILINSAASATCVITSFAAVGADADTGIVTDTSCDTGLKNTASSNAIGDTLTLVSDGTRWLGVGITAGVWAAQ